MTTYGVPQRPVTAAPRRSVATVTGRAVLTVLAAMLFVLGWTAGATWLALRWLVAAVAVGFDAAQTAGPARGERR
jgi:small-conductance mechanosensitive channel